MRVSRMKKPSQHLVRTISTCRFFVSKIRGEGVRENHLKNDSNFEEMEGIIQKAWSPVAPAWPLSSLVASNPLRGFEEKSWEQALKEAYLLFQKEHKWPTAFHDMNRETIKWCQAFFDHGQATISMPDRHLGFYPAWHRL